ncbi:radical SAM protein [Tropicibacter oceani]|uniref:SPASM domain-containing protein n=1 Tax=Tropicibacter oceani TaxID=3058420 RepID=A0ABY8QN28_9RHOB|nr:radical SAM protein [Tropicibacter oceani]WGW06034.1 SPASM domain-containing protein [Tropicibacter oceani]
MSAYLSRIVLTDQMPLTFNALVVEYTGRCTAKCGMCYQSAGPKGSDILGDRSLDRDTIRRLLREARAIPTLEPRFHLTGGEAFLNEGLLLDLIGHARQLGYIDLTTTTNAYWATTPARADRVCARAAKAGMTAMEISWDHWHRDYLDPDLVSNCLEACARHGITSNLRLLSTRAHSYGEALRDLRPKALSRVGSISCAPVHPTGRAMSDLPPEDIWHQGTLDDTCHAILNLTVNPRGDVSPCCAGLDQLACHSFGNVADDSIAEIARRLDASPVVRTLVFRGVLEIAALLAEAGVDPGTDHTGICHMCWSMFSDPGVVQAIESALAARRARAIRQALDQLRTAARQKAEA